MNRSLRSCLAWLLLVTALSFCCLCFGVVLALWYLSERGLLM
jgi:hypothetical protein